MSADSANTTYRPRPATNGGPPAPSAVATAAGGAEHFGTHAGRLLDHDDPHLADLLAAEMRRQHQTLAMVAASSIAHPSVLACAGSVLTNLTTEGYPGARFHAGCEVADEIELLAAARACAVFGARYANVQPHSGSSANLCAIAALIDPGDVLLGMDLADGGHLTHGSPASVVGRHYRAVGYGVDAAGLIDYGEVARLAREHRPRLIVCGASSYPRTIDFARFREIADSVGATLLADISHIAGLVATGLHPSPVDHAHVTTTSTYKQLCGPRGGLILLGADADTVIPDSPGRGRGTLRSLMQRAVFPAGQGTPDLAAVAAKARALDMVAQPAFHETAGRIVSDAVALAHGLASRGYRVLTGGTDNHMVLVDLRPAGLSGAAAEGALEECGVIVNRNRVPGDTSPARIAAGLRFGTNSLAVRGMDPASMADCAELIDSVLTATEDLGGGRHRLAEKARDQARDTVRTLCERYPLPGYEPLVPAGP